VRLDIGLDGARRIGETAHFLVWCDAIATEEVPLHAVPPHLEVIDARLGAAAAIADRLLCLQAERGERTMVAVVAAGAPIETPDGFPVEDILLAGAIVDALGAVGIDATSPEAAASAAAFGGLAGAVGHMLTASVAGRRLAETEGVDAVRAARARLDESEVHVLREFSIPA
jgi:2-phosphosulfolactate phosphatase